MINALIESSNVNAPFIQQMKAQGVNVVEPTIVTICKFLKEHVNIPSTDEIQIIQEFAERKQLK